MKQRLELKRKGKAGPDRQNVFEDIGLGWDLVECSTQVPWEERFDLLKQLKQHEGRCSAKGTETTLAPGQAINGI